MKMLSHNPDERPTIDEIRKHPWMTSLNSVKAQREIISKLRRSDNYKMTFKIDMLSS